MRSLSLAGLAGLTIAGFAPAALAFLPPEPIARTGFTSGFNLPAGASVNSSDAYINDNRQIAWRINVLPAGAGGGAGILLGDYTGLATGGSVSASIPVTVNTAFTNEIGLTNAGRLLAVESVSGTPRLFTWDAANGQQQVNFPLGGTGLAGSRINADGNIGGRVALGTGRAIGTFAAQTAGTPTLNPYIVQNNVDASSPYSFLYVPMLARDSGVFATRADRSAAGGGGSQILRLDGPGNVQAVATNTAGDPSSPFSTFFNSVAVSPDGSKVTFFGRTEGNATRLFLFDAGTGVTTEIAAAGAGNVQSLDVFNANVNDLGQVVFRGNAVGGGSSVFVYDGGSVSRVAGVGDTVMTDIGLVTLGRRDNAASQGGAPAINNLGDIAYNFQYFFPENPNSVADGTLLLVSVIPEPASLGLLGLAGMTLLRRRR